MTLGASIQVPLCISTAADPSDTCTGVAVSSRCTPSTLLSVSGNLRRSTRVSSPALWKGRGLCRLS